MTIDDKFGMVLRDLRESCGKTQEQLAFEADLDRTYISLLERGLRQPSLTTVFSLSRALGVSPTQFVQLVEEAVDAAGESGKHR